MAFFSFWEKKYCICELSGNLKTLNSRLTTISGTLDSANLKVTTGSVGIIGYAKWGNIVSISCTGNYAYTASDRMTWLTIATLPSGYRPRAETAGTLYAFGAMGWYRVRTTGVVEIISTSDTSATEPVRFSAAFVVA